MNEIQTAIEGYNKEKFNLTDCLISKGQYGNKTHYDYLRERIKQIDVNIERLLTLEYYPTN